MRPSRPQAVSRSSGSSQKSQKSSRYAFDPLDDPRPEPFEFPRTHHLIVTTPQAVYTYGRDGITEIFRSGSSGIVAAKRANNGPRVLAVADDQLVILHDVRKGMRRSHKLRAEDVCYHYPSLLYSLHRSSLLHDDNAERRSSIRSRARQTIGSSISSPFAPYCLRDFSNITLAAFYFSFATCDSCSSAAVVLVEFHPERGNVFILAFADATCAVYDAASIFRGGSRGERGSGVSGSGNGCEISNIKNLHEPGKATSNAPGSNPDAKQSVWVVAAGFVPSHNATVVTVGSDGRCCVVDFAATETNKASLICAWDTTGSPTSLSVLSPNPEYGLELPIARLRSRESTHRNNVVAIGCQDGKVLFFDLAGNLLFQQPLGSNGHRVIDVEWLEGDDWSEPSATRPAPNDTSKGRSRNKRKSIGEVLASGRPVAEEVLAIIDDPNAEQESEKALKKALPTGGSPSGSGADRANPAEDDAKMRQSSAVSHMDLPSMVQTTYPEEVNYEDSSRRADTSSSSSLENILRNFPLPDPSKYGESQRRSLQRKGLGQLPKNNSWAADLQRRNGGLQEGSYNTVAEEVGDLKEGLSKPGSVGGSRRRRPTTRAMNATDQAAAYQDDLWTDIAIDDRAPDQSRGSQLVDKENSPSHEVAFATDDSITEPAGLKTTDETSRYRQDRKAKQPDVPVTIHVDEREQVDHPQPLKAHPEKSPSSGPRPLMPTNLNSSHPASAIRAPIHRQRFKNGNLESHRSSIYGPGALARKVQQEVMVTVNVELDVLRREMGGKFAAQKAWFIKELMNSQEWTLRVEEENRKLREELAKERRRRVLDREGMRTLC
ncbi:MAG: hypothetical protein LQ338_003820 [Usnochroma carphineum]|nr:MAG: hypothetical protein LQ338_003820 [Usnochroma carphineum]